MTCRESRLCPACPADTSQNLRFCRSDPTGSRSKRVLAALLLSRPAPTPTCSACGNRTQYTGSSSSLRHWPPCPCVGSLHHYRQRRRAFITSQYLTRDSGRRGSGDTYPIPTLTQRKQTRRALRSDLSLKQIEKMPWRPLRLRKPGSKRKGSGLCPEPGDGPVMMNSAP